MAACRRKRIQLSAMSLEEKQRLGGYIKKLGGVFIDNKIFVKQATHVITGKPNRGEKYLGGCALGKWVLQKEFIEDSYKKGSWLNEEKYEWTSEVLDAGISKELLSLYDAPRKWRMCLQNKSGVFKSWSAIVYFQDNKMKKAYERLLEAGNAMVCKKKISFHDSDLPKDLTHVFVEPNLQHNVLHLESKGILVCSPDFIPDYIIQASKDASGSSNNIIMKYKNLTNTYPIPKRKEKHVVHPGKENGEVVEMKIKDHSVVKGATKRLASDCDLCMAKRQKTTSSTPSLANTNATQQAEKGKHLTFPGYASNILESCIDEGCLDLGMESVTSSLSTNQAPTPKWLHIIMKEFLINAPSEEQAFQSYHLLQNILELHHPASCQSLYLEALHEASASDSQRIDRSKSTPWDFISKVIRNCLEDKPGCEEAKRLQRNSGLLLRFLNNLFKIDFSTVGQPTSLLTHILWPTKLLISLRQSKEFISLCCMALRLAVRDSNKMSVGHVLLNMLSMAATLKKRDDVTGQACESLAQQLFLEISKTECYEATKFLLQGCQCPWLKMRILELILENFDKRLIPQEYRELLNKTLKFNKIVLCYFFLLPNMRGTDKTKEMMDGKPMTAKRTRKNGKGETPLHRACIRNDVAKMEEMLKDKNVDVNMKDNAGWTALHEACNRGHVQCVKKILQYHERTNSVNLLACPDDGITVLHDAVVNNHLPVVKLLIPAGGLDLLQATTTSGMTALQLARTNEMSQFIESELSKLNQSRTLAQENIRRPSAVEYDNVLRRNKRKQFVPLQDCEKYLFFLSQLVLVYTKENILVSNNTLASTSEKFCTNCEVDVECCRNFSQHVLNLEQHVQFLSGKQNLSQLCELYLTSMKLCASYV